jgi:subtilisin family serine protease
MEGTVRHARRAQRRFALWLERLERRSLLDGAGNLAPTLLVGFQAGATSGAISAAVSTVGGTIAESFPDGTDVVSLGPGVDPSAALPALRAAPAVAYAEPDSTIQATDIPTVSPNNPDFPLQWGLNNPDNVDIDAPQAWAITTGSPAVVVAVLDTGIDLRNPDLTSRLWTNPTAGFDGYKGDLHGWNFVNNNANLQDNNTHGTHVAGILAAAGNSGSGIAGVDWNARIMSVKVLAANGSGSISAAVSGIMFAVDHGARVINASWGGSQFSQSMLDAINYANSKGCVFVTAAGNDGLDNDVNVANYPANYRLPNELVVAAVDASGNLASFSDYGAQTVDLGAPGVNVYSTIPHGFATYSGTSMATPYVAGVVSLVAGQNPGLSAAGLVQRVLATVKPLPSLAGKTVSGGMVDAYYALTYTPSAQAQTLAPPVPSGSVSAGSVPDPGSVGKHQRHHHHPGRAGHARLQPRLDGSGRLLRSDRLRIEV